MENFKRESRLLIELVLFTSVMLLGFVGPGDIFIQSANAQDSKTTKQAKSEYLKAVPRIEVSNKSAPILQGATCGSILPQGAEPISLRTNGTIGPPGPDMPVNSGSKPSKKLTIASMFLFSIAASLMVVFLKVIRQSSRNAIWMYGSIAAALLMVTGFIWGNNINF